MSHRTTPQQLLLLLHVAIHTQMQKINPHLLLLPSFTVWAGP
jgi:hypothetical protein